MKRPPVVVVVGHVDHGKTSLLDYIRKANVASKEAGSITQSIGAYEIDYPSTSSGQAEKITFIDTPGHRAFAQMRVRGAKIADIAILVVAVDDGVQEQTREALKVLQDTTTPFVVAITKIDKNVDLTKVKNDLTQSNVLLEGYGGNISWQGVSAKTGDGINDLLNLILLTAELEDLKYDPNNPGRGFVLESKIDNRKGITATVIVMDGKLKVGDEICVASPKAGAASVRAKIRSLENFLGKSIKEAEPSSPILVTGFKEVPVVGGELMVGGELAGAIPPSSQIKKPVLPIKTKEGEVVINLILKADSNGSLEALSTVMRNLSLPPNFRINIISEGIGEITDGDVKWEPQVIVGFRVGSNRAAMDLARSQEVRIMASDIIYDLIKQLEEWIKNIGSTIISGDLEILAVFGEKGGQQIIGGRVTSGEVKNNSAFDVQRNGKSLGVGRIVNLQRQKADTIKAVVGEECGLLVNAEVAIKTGDHLIFK